VNEDNFLRWVSCDLLFPNIHRLTICLQKLIVCLVEEKNALNS
jgi:hypothetical protein